MDMAEKFREQMFYPLKRGHLSNQDTFLGLNCVLKEVSLYTLYHICNYTEKLLKR